MGWIASLALAAASAAAPPRNTADTLAWRPPALTRMDSLFIAAATGEPRFARLRDSCEKALVAMGGPMLEYLYSRRLSGGTPRQTHYLERLFALVSDSGRHAAARESLAAFVARAPDSLKPRLLYIGSWMGDPAFSDSALRWLRHDSLEVRKMALRNLGAHPKQAYLAPLLDGIWRTRDLELSERLWALSQFPALPGPSELMPRLAFALSDPNLYNRQPARRVLAKSAGRDWVRLWPFLPADLGPEARREWILLALDCEPSPAARAFLERQTPNLDPGARAFVAAAMRARPGFSSAAPGNAAATGVPAPRP